MPLRNPTHDSAQALDRSSLCQPPVPCSRSNSRSVLSRNKLEQHQTLRCLSPDPSTVFAQHRSLQQVDHSSLSTHAATHAVAHSGPRCGSTEPTLTGARSEPMCCRLPASVHFPWEFHNCTCCSQTSQRRTSRRMSSRRCMYASVNTLRCSSGSSCHFLSTAREMSFMVEPGGIDNFTPWYAFLKNRWYGPVGWSWTVI